MGQECKRPDMGAFSVFGKSKAVCGAAQAVNLSGWSQVQDVASTRITWVLIGLSKNFGFHSENDGTSWMNREEGHDLVHILE